VFLAPTTTVVRGADRRPRPGRVWFARLVPPFVVPSGFSQAAITRVAPPVQYGTQLLLSWSSVAPVGTNYQVYVDRALVWHGTSLSAVVPTPAGIARIDIGTVGPGQATTDFSGSLPGAPNRLVTLSWLGGTYEGADLVGFHVYGSAVAGGAIDYANVLATVPAYTAGVITDGYGYGGYGQGGYGEAASSYAWTSDALAVGAWSWGVRPFDAAGNEGPTTTTTVLIFAPPNEPRLCFGDGTRMHYTYDFPSKEATLNWCASPP
jgi:hypothetical protein